MLNMHKNPASHSRHWLSERGLPDYYQFILQHQNGDMKHLQIDLKTLSFMLFIHIHMAFSWLCTSQI